MKKIAGIYLVVLLFGLSPGFVSAQGISGKRSGEFWENFDDQYGAESEDADLNEILGGFDSDKAEGDFSNTVVEEYKTFFGEISGAETLGVVYNFAHDSPEEGSTDYRGLSRFRSELELTLEFRLSEDWNGLISGRAYHDFSYGFRGRDEFTEEVLESLEQEAEFREVYIGGNFSSNLDVKIGRQIVVWGRSDSIRVTDILNPVDFREPGISDIENLRLPVVMTMFNYYFRDWSLSGIAIHEIRFNKDPPFGSDFYVFEEPPVDEEIPSDGYNNTEYGIALNGIFDGWDISFYGARYFEDQAHPEEDSLPGLTSVPEFKLRHSQLYMGGMAGSMAKGNWLFRTDMAYFNGLEFFVLPGETKTRFDALLGVDYSGVPHSIFFIEIVNRHINSYDLILLGPPDYAAEDEFQSMFRYQGDFFRDTTHLIAVISMRGFAGEDGRLGRISLKYDISDAFSMTVGAVLYQSGDEILVPVDQIVFKDIGDNDRLFLEARYSF